MEDIHTIEAEIQALKAGDAVLIRVGHTHWAERTVTRVTATQVLVGETRYHRRNSPNYTYRAGDEVGRRGHYSNACIRALTPARRAQREAEERRAALEHATRAALQDLERYAKDGSRTDAELEAFVAYVKGLG